MLSLIILFISSYYIKFINLIEKYKYKIDKEIINNNYLFILDNFKIV